LNVDKENKSVITPSLKLMEDEYHGEK
jgi:hypothetical protein